VDPRHPEEAVHEGPEDDQVPPVRPSSRAGTLAPHGPSHAYTEADEGAPIRPESTRPVGDQPISGSVRAHFESPEPPAVERLHTGTSSRPIDPPLGREEIPTPFDFQVADESRGQLEELNAAANRLHLTAAAAQEAEDQRELEFRNHEEHRDDIFLQNEERRTQEARDRAAGIWNELETRLSALPPPPAVVETPEPAERPELDVSDRESIHTIKTAITQAASQHASDVLETVKEEREEAARERQEMAEERASVLAELKRERDLIVQEKDARISALEEELARLREEFDAEKHQRAAEEAEIREREQREMAERDDYVRAQLTDLTNLVQDQRDMLENKKAVADSRYEEKQTRRADKEMQFIELRDMVQKIYEDMEVDRQQAQNERRHSKDGMCHVTLVVSVLTLFV
jgi:hypothetical protein